MKNPIYQDVYFKLRKLITSGEYMAGDFLPTEDKLEAIYKVSRTTIRKAVEMLAADGYIEVKQGRGTRVLDYQYTQNLNRVTSVSDTLRQKGYEVIIKDIYIDRIEASIHIAEKLGVKENTGLYRIQRVLSADTVPTAILLNYISVDLAPGLDEKSGKISRLYKFLESEFDIFIDSCVDTIFAKNADFVESQMLNIKTGSALLEIHRVTYQTGRPITYDISTMRADRYQFEVKTSGR
ncbi:GntR family transcriptional regulator [Treponema sp. TIM-1]|uniref:GntR family transcriptional regulator n=1 Tax=Treponema sp. TIM-1 TaxID=2898417 RepID=UPI00397EC511